MKLLSFFEKDDEQLDDNKEFIELMSCPRDGVNCVEHRKGINKNLLSAQRSQINKEYRKSIDELKEAYFMAGDLEKESCLACAELFRTTIINSLKQIKLELERMSTGIFRKNRYKTSFLFAAETLSELEKHHFSIKK